MLSVLILYFAAILFCLVPGSDAKRQPRRAGYGKTIALQSFTIDKSCDDTLLDNVFGDAQTMLSKAQQSMKSLKGTLGGHNKFRERRNAAHMSFGLQSPVSHRIRK